MTPGVDFQESVPDFYTPFLFGIFTPENSPPKFKPKSKRRKISAVYKAHSSEPDPGGQKTRPKKQPRKMKPQKSTPLWDPQKKGPHFTPGIKAGNLHPHIAAPMQGQKSTPIHTPAGSREKAHPIGTQATPCRDAGQQGNQEDRDRLNWTEQEQESKAQGHRLMPSPQAMRQGKP